MNNITKGLISGFIATLAIALLMGVKAWIGLYPELSTVQMQWNLLHRFFDAPAQPMTGWISHFIIGTVIWGGAFGAFNSYIPGETELSRGVWIGILAWILMMVVIMPLAGAGFFGMGIGIGAPLLTLFLHVVFGLVLGYAYAKMINVGPREKLPLPEAV